jgi:hypothetical protein
VVYDVLLIGRATAKANARDIIEPWNPPITAGLQECMHQCGRIDEDIELRPILDSLTARPHLAAAVSEEARGQLPLLFGGISVALARKFRVLDAELTAVHTDEWAGRRRSARTWRDGRDCAADGAHAGLPITDSVLLPDSRAWHLEPVGPYSVLDKGLQTELSLMQADLGIMQILDPAAGSLRIAVQAGFSAEFLQYFASVDDDTSACGRAASQRAQIVIADVNADPGFARHRDIAAAARFRAVQSNPLVDVRGRVVSVPSTFYPRPYRPHARDPGNHATVRRAHRAGHRGVPERR